MTARPRKITISVPADVADEFAARAREAGRTESQLFVEMLAVYRAQVENATLRSLGAYGTARARDAGLTEDDVERLISESRQT